MDPSTALRFFDGLRATFAELMERHDFRAAIPVGAELVAIAEEVEGPWSGMAAVAWNNLGSACQGAGNLQWARRAFHRAVDIHEAILGPQHPELAINLGNLGGLYRALGDFPHAIEFNARALTILESAYGANDERVGTTLNNLALAYMFSGDFVTPEPLLRNAIRIAKEASAMPELAASIKNLAEVLFGRGQYPDAAELYAEAQSLFREHLGDDHPLVATALVGYADARMREVERLPSPDAREEIYKRVEALLCSARTICEQRLGADHSQVAFVDSRLVALARARGRVDEALALARAIAQRLSDSMGPANPETLKQWNTVAVLCLEAGHLDEAERLHLETLEREERVFGQASRATLITLDNLMHVYLAQGKIEKAIITAENASRIEDPLIERVLRSSPDSARRAFLGAQAGARFMAILSLHVDFAPDDPAALSLALTTVLRRKGLALEASVDVMRALRQTFSPAAQRSFDAYRTAASELATLVLADRPSETERRRAIEQQLARIEEELSGESAAFRQAIAPPVTIDTVQKALADDAALIEFVIATPIGHRGTAIERMWDWSRARYVAYVLRSNAPPEFVELAPASLVDDLCRRFRKAIGARTPDAGVLARRLDELLMLPVRALLGQARLLHLSLEGPIHLIPFAALRDENNEPLLARYLINHVDRGRDILRFGARQPPREEAVIFAAPDFGVPNASSAFMPLAGTEAEARTVSAAMPRARLLTGKHATKAALAKVHGPRVVHLATHGVFRSGSERQTVFPDYDGMAVDAMARSGVVLAGVNTSFAEGYLSADEILGIDLIGTRVVVMSACGTGLIDRRTMDEIYGLRRALSIAGAQSQVLSLWKVHDFATAEFMAAYYGALSRGVTRAEALRSAQVLLMRHPEYADPVFWAAFISLGDVGAVDLNEPLQSSDSLP
ncbi:CHAT domain-containing protein [Pendulispora albinea]|uniref:CHAT domain-containing protein n=1 Tax=Pendulispora albinea TaxID=2741071 RepID=A0ABZ2MCN9_9BACT